MDSAELIGTWTTVSAGGFAVEGRAGAIATGRGGSGMSYEFDAEGNYVYGSFFDIAIADETIAIYETGAYGVARRPKEWSVPGSNR